MENTSG